MFHPYNTQFLIPLPVIVSKRPLCCICNGDERFQYTNWPVCCKTVRRNKYRVTITQLMYQIFPIHIVQQLVRATDLWEQLTVASPSTVFAAGAA